MTRARAIPRRLDALVIPGLIGLGVALGLAVRWAIIGAEYARSLEGVW
jgi:hypothetical protein